MDLLVLVRIRNQIIGYFELVASVQDQVAYQSAAPHIHVPHEVMNQWEDWVQSDWRNYLTMPVFSPEEAEAIECYSHILESVAAGTPDPLPALEDLIDTPEWQRLVKASAAALRAFEVRGRLPDTSEGA